MLVKALSLDLGGFLKSLSTVATYSYTRSVYLCLTTTSSRAKRHHPAQWAGPQALCGRWEAIPEPSRRGSGPVICAKVILEIYNPATDKLVTRWDIDIVYG